MMISLPLIDADAGALPLTAITSDGLPAWSAAQPESVRKWIEATGFSAEAGSTCLIAGADGALHRVLVGLGVDDPWAGGRLARDLPPGAYCLEEIAGLEDDAEAAAATSLALAWALGAYRFERYKAEPAPAPATLVWPEDADRDFVDGAARAAWLTRDLINTPAEDMGPDALAAAADALAQSHGAACAVTIGDDLLADNFPAIHAVGRAAAIAPRLIDMTWGEASGPKVTLVGKGVCFDSGGLDIKPASGMRLMKKDMGGAATVLGLADWIMRANLPVRLRVLIPAVENAISGNAFRPGDVVSTRKGPTIEVGNTDAEGRVVLADALALACEEKPDLIVDCATLTGAARVALGPELPAMFSPDDVLADSLMAAGMTHTDPVWRLPLWAGYRRLIDSKVADISNSGESGFAGAITAALFLKTFVDDGVSWVHLDLFGWNPDDRPGRPAGGEAYAQRALFAVIRERFA
jgi:leucyl aminopeptidase